MKNEVIKVNYELNGEQVELDSETVKRYLVNGQGSVTDQEIKMFIELCKAQKLNPFIKDAYLIKYGSQPAQTITSKDVFLKRAEENEDYDGMKCGIIVDNGEDIVYRNGAFYNKKKEEVVGGWAEVYRKSQKQPCRVEVSFDEYAQRRNTGELNSMWANKSGTMIRKVALCQALRESFPNALQQLYGSEEMGVQEQFESVPVKKEVEKQVVDNSQKQGVEDLTDLISKFKSIRSDIESEGVDTRDLTFVKAICKRAKVNSIDVEELVVDEEGMKRVIDELEKSLTKIKDNKQIEIIEGEIVEGEILNEQ